MQSTENLRVKTLCLPEMEVIMAKIEKTRPDVPYPISDDLVAKIATFVFQQLVAGAMLRRVVKASLWKIAEDISKIQDAEFDETCSSFKIMDELVRSPRGKEALLRVAYKVFAYIILNPLALQKPPLPGLNLPDPQTLPPLPELNLPDPQTLPPLPELNPSLLVKRIEEQPFPPIHEISKSIALFAARPLDCFLNNKLIRAMPVVSEIKFPLFFLIPGAPRSDAAVIFVRRMENGRHLKRS